MDKALRHLSADTRLAGIIRQVGDYSIRSGGEPFRSLVEAIIYQQLAGGAADAIYSRFMGVYRGRFPSPLRLLSTPGGRLRSAGLSGRKVEYIKDLASHVKDGRLNLRKLYALDDEQVVEQLTAVKGIGRWTAEMFLIFCLGRPDVLPVGDLGLRKAIQKAYSLRRLPSPERMGEIAEPWRPYRSVATWYLWKSREIQDDRVAILPAPASLPC
jgi:DNA-3-methyladenine glycosylase II